MAKRNYTPEEAKTRITLYEFYALGIERLLVKAPWELERSVSAYHESFLTEQRCLGLAILVLLGEEHVPEKAVPSMPGFEEQSRASVNQAVFLRALKRFFEQKGIEVQRANLVLERMQAYIADSKAANKGGKSPLSAMLNIVVKRVPPKDQSQRDLYEVRVGKIYDYIEGLVEKGLLKRYQVSS